MPGSLRQRGKSWELKVYLGRDAVSGRKRWAYRSFRGGKREAQRALAAMVAEADRGGLARTTSTVGDLLEEWYSHAAPSFSPKNVVETRGVLDRNLLPFLATIPLAKLGAADLDRFYRQRRGQRLGVLAPRLGVAIVHAALPAGRHQGRAPARSQALRGDSAPVVGGRRPHGRRPTRPPQRGDHAQRVLPLPRRGRPGCGGRVGSPVRRAVERDAAEKADP